ncbi:MAG: trypsin-like peptidase domain-containing protein [Pseudomonadota bacterium]
MRDLFRYILLPAGVGALIGLSLLALSHLQQPRTGFAEAVARAAPAVVNIYTSARVRPAFCERPEYSDWCDRMSRRTGNQVQSSLGSGVIVHSDGFILTNNHVVANADEVLVAFHNGQATTATIIGTDLETDLAVIKVQASGLTAIPMGNSDAVAVGDVALAIGNPFGLGQTVSAGIISAKGRMGITESPYSDFLQTDAAINLGNSGGALINATGELIGINTLIFTRSGGSEGIGFAIPERLAMKVLKHLVETGEVIRGWLGLELGAAPAPGARTGLRVNAVLYDGPAYRAGLRVGDLVQAVDGVPASAAVPVSRQIADAEPGQRLKLAIERGGETRILEAVAIERPALRP